MKCPRLTYAYTTPRVVSLVDKRLFVLNLACIVAILSYLGFSVIYNQRYRKIAVDLVGTVRLQLAPPEASYSTPANETGYCGSGPGSYAGPNAVPFTRYNCSYLDAYDVVYPSLEASAMLIATRITRSSQYLPHGCKGQPVQACQYVNRGQNETTYVADVDFMTLLIDHSFAAGGLSASTLQMEGTIVDGNGTPLNPCDDYREAGFNTTCPPYIHVGLMDHTDILPVRTLMRAAGITSLDEYGTPSSSGSGPQTKRYAGCVLVVSISYSNSFAKTGTWGENTFRYTYSVSYVPNTEFKTEEITPEPGSDAINRTIIDRHGIRILVRQSGDIGRFSFVDLIITLTSSLGLFAAARALVDFSATSLMPMRRVYSAYKTVQSLTLHDLGLTKKELGIFEKADLINPVPPLIHLLARRRGVGGGGSGGNATASETQPELPAKSSYLDDGFVIALDSDGQALTFDDFADVISPPAPGTDSETGLGKLFHRSHRNLLAEHGDESIVPAPAMGGGGRSSSSELSLPLLTSPAASSSLTSNSPAASFRGSLN